MQTKTDKLKFRVMLSLGVAFLALSILTTTKPGSADPQSFVQIQYQGELRDGSNRPIAGVYPLEFAIYPTDSSKKALWTENHWVAVDRGTYRLKLGTVKRIRANLAKEGQKVSLGVSLEGGGELVRDAIVFPKAAEEPEAEEREAEPEKAEGDTKTEPVPASDKDKPVYKMESSFAEVAEYAKRAGVAENAEKVGGRDVEELEAEYDKLRTQLSEHRTDATLHGGGGLGDETRTMPRVGGKGGQRYERKCPDGFVMTGIRGGAGALLDSVEIICTRLK